MEHYLIDSLGLKKEGDNFFVKKISPVTGFYDSCKMYIHADNLVSIKASKEKDVFDRQILSMYQVTDYEELLRVLQGFPMLHFIFPTIHIHHHD